MTDLNKISQEDVMQKALGFLPFPKKYFRNPFRTDNHPSAFVKWDKGRLRFYDRAALEFNCLDCWDVYQLRHDLGSFKESLDHYQGKEVVVSVGLDRYNPEEIPFRLRFSPILWDEEGLAYWDDYGISEKDLISDGIYQVGSFFYKSKEGLKIQIIPEDVCFALTIADRVKLYRPTTTEKHRKWMSDTHREQFWYIRQGDTFSHTALVTSSYKDARVAFNNTSYDCLAPGVSEVDTAANLAGDPVMRLLMNYERVILSMDFDKAGRTANFAWKQALDYHGIPNVEFTFNSKGKLKDISDFRKWDQETFEDELLPKLVKLTKI